MPYSLYDIRFFFTPHQMIFFLPPASKKSCHIYIFSKRMWVFFTIGYLWNLKFTFDGNTFSILIQVFEKSLNIFRRRWLVFTYARPSRLTIFTKWRKWDRIMQDLERENVCVYKIEVWLFIYKLTMCMAKIICKDAVHYTDWKNVKDF